MQDPETEGFRQALADIRGVAAKRMRQQVDAKRPKPAPEAPPAAAAEAVDDSAALMEQLAAITSTPEG